MKQRLAHFISTVGSPVVILLGFTLYTTLQHLQGAAVPICLGTTLVFALVFIGYMTWQVRSGRIANLDASVRSERQNKVYLPIIGAFGVSLALFWWLGQTRLVLVSTACLLLLFVVGFLVTYRLKASLHTAVPCYLGVTALVSDPAVGLFLLAITPAIAWSRIVLGRHTLREVLAGAGIALLVAAVFYAF